MSSDILKGTYRVNIFISCIADIDNIIAIHKYLGSIIKFHDDLDGRLVFSNRIGKNIGDIPNKIASMHLYSQKWTITTMTPMKLMRMNNLMTGHITNENTVMTGETTQLTTWKQNMKMLIYRSDNIGPAEND